MENYKVEYNLTWIFNDEDGDEVEEVSEGAWIGEAENADTATEWVDAYYEEGDETEMVDYVPEGIWVDGFDTRLECQRIYERVGDDWKLVRQLEGDSWIDLTA